jgi:hypothetical protein
MESASTAFNSAVIALGWARAWPRRMRSRWRNAGCNSSLHCSLAFRQEDGGGAALIALAVAGLGVGIAAAVGASRMVVTPGTAGSIRWQARFIAENG